MCVGTQTGEEGPHCHSTMHTGGKAMASGTQDHSLYSLYLMAGTEEGKRNPAKLPSGSEQGTCTWRERGWQVTEAKEKGSGQLSLNVLLLCKSPGMESFLINDTLTLQQLSTANIMQEFPPLGLDCEFLKFTPKKSLE